MPKCARDFANRHNLRCGQKRIGLGLGWGLARQGAVLDSGMQVKALCCSCHDAAKHWLSQAEQHGGSKMGVN